MSSTSAQRTAESRGSTEPAAPNPDRLDNGAEAHEVTALRGWRNRESSVPRTAAATAISQLSDLLLTSELGDDQLDRITDTIEQLHVQLDGDARPDRVAWWRADEPAKAYRLQSPFGGAQNPRAVTLDIDLGDDDPPTVTGHAVVGAGFGGPPHAVHGGVLSGIFDEVLGTLAGRVAPHKVVVTARLQVRYRLPTPLAVPLSIQARVRRSTPRRILVEADCVVDQQITASAQALMIAR